MRNITKGIIGLFIAFLSITTTSCDDTELTDLLPSMKATVDGESWTSLFRISTVTDSSIVIIGTPSTSENADKTIALTAFGSTEGTYQLNLGTLSSDCLVSYKKTANAVEGEDNYYVSYEATIVVSKIDTENKKLSGTFNAKLRSTGSLADEVIISKGSFENLNYQ